MNRFEPRYVFRETEPDAFQFWRGDESSGFLCSSCTRNPWEREFPVYRDEMPETFFCERCDRTLNPGLGRWRGLLLSYRLFRVFGNGIIKSLKKALWGGSQLVSPDRW